MRPIKLGRGFKLDKNGRVASRDPSETARDVSAKIRARQRKNTPRAVRRGTIVATKPKTQDDTPSPDKGKP